MQSTIYLRPIVLDDAKVSYKWRNDSEIWKFTKYQPKETVTPEMETEWLLEILKRPNERRFAICTIDTHQYIGNVYFNDIIDQSASAHIVIGEKCFWGKGIASEVAMQFLDYGFSQLNFKRVYLEVNCQNDRMIGFYLRLGFESIGQSGNYLKMLLLRQKFHDYIKYKNTVLANVD